MQGVHRGGLHVLLWQMQGNAASVRVEQARLAALLGVSRWSMSRILARMATEGRLRPVRSGSRVTTYEVVDPSMWADRRDAAEGG